METIVVISKITFQLVLVWMLIEAILQGRKYRKLAIKNLDLMRELNHYKKHADVQDRIIKENQARLRKYESKQK